MPLSDEAAARLRERASRPWLLWFFAPFLLLSTIFSLLAGHYGLFFLKLAGFSLYYGSVKLLEKGLREELAYRHAVIAKAPFPYKSLAAAAMGATLLFLERFTAESSWLTAVVVALVGALGMVLYYGTDPRADKLPDLEGEANPDRLLASIAEAEATLARIEEAWRKVEDPALSHALGEALEEARRVLARIKSDPREVRMARKFLVVYLDGVADVMARYHAVENDRIDPDMRRRLAEVLAEAKARFHKEAERMRSDDLFDLDVEIDALKEQFKGA